VPSFQIVLPTREDFMLMLEVDIAFINWITRTCRIDKVRFSKLDYELQKTHW
jgi:hypothetical protein